MNVKISEKEPEVKLDFREKHVHRQNKDQRKIKFSEAKALFLYIFYILPIDSGNRV